MKWSRPCTNGGQGRHFYSRPLLSLTSICARSAALNLGSALASGSHNVIRLRMTACKSFSSTYVSPSEERLRQACLGGNRLKKEVLYCDLKSPWLMKLTIRERGRLPAVREPSAENARVPSAVLRVWVFSSLPWTCGKPSVRKPQYQNAA